MDRPSRFGYLLEPIRDLTKNWEVDVASQLDDYLSEIVEIRISFDGGATSLNFAEAALLIQGSACIYSRKVEYLHALVYQTLDLLSSKRKLAHGSSVDDQGRDSDVSVRHEEPLLVLDDLPVSNVDMQGENHSNTTLMVSTSVPRTPLSLIPLRGSEKVNSTPLLSRTGELLGSNVDFKMNTGYVHSSGALILEPLGHQLVISVTKRGATHPITITSNTPAAVVASMLSGAEPRDTDMDASDGGAPPMDDSGVCEDLGASPLFGDRPGHSSAPSRHRPASLRKKRVRVMEKKFINPLLPLDPHTENTRDKKPLKKGVTQRVPAGLTEMGCGDQSSSDRGGGGDSAAAVGQKRPLRKHPVKNDSLASFIHRSLYSCSSLFPKTYFKAPASAEFEGLYWEEQKAHKQQRKADTKKLRALLSDDSVAEMGEQDQDTYHPVGQDEVSDVEEEAGRGDAPPPADEEQFHAAFERFHDVPSSFQGVEPMALEEGSGSLGTPLKSHRCNYEDLVREYVETTTVAATAYANETDLSRRVADWEAKIKPILDHEEHHPSFDIHVCGSRVIDTFRDNNELELQELAEGKELYEISRIFAATLQLANDGNVEISSEGLMDAVGLKLLSTRRKFENVANYRSSSH